MKTDKLTVYRLFLSQDEINEIADEMETAFTKNTLCGRTVFEDDYMIRIAMTNNLSDNKLVISDNIITLNLRYTEARQIAEKMKEKCTEATHKDIAEVVSYTDHDNTFLQIIAKQ